MRKHALQQHTRDALLDFNPPAAIAPNTSMFWVVTVAAGAYRLPPNLAVAIETVVPAT